MNNNESIIINSNKQEPYKESYKNFYKGSESLGILYSMDSHKSLINIMLKSEKYNDNDKLLFKDFVTLLESECKHKNLKFRYKNKGTFLLCYFKKLDPVQVLNLDNYKSGYNKDLVFCNFNNGNDENLANEHFLNIFAYKKAGGLDKNNLNKSIANKLYYLTSNQIIKKDISIDIKEYIYNTFTFIDRVVYQCLYKFNDNSHILELKTYNDITQTQAAEINTRYYLLDKQNKKLINFYDEKDI